MFMTRQRPADAHTSQVPLVRDSQLVSTPRWARTVKWMPTLLTFTFLFLIISCGFDVEDPTPPSAPVWVQKSLPEEWPERGIDAHESGGIFLEWEPRAEENIEACHLYRAQYYDVEDSLGAYELIRTIDYNDQTANSYVDSYLFTRTKYYYKLRAEDTAGNMSLFSDSTFYTLLPQISLEGMEPNGSLDTLTDNQEFSWRYSYHVEMEVYTVTIIDSQGNLVLRQMLTPGNYVSGNETWLPHGQKEMQSGEVYQWRIDASAIYSNRLESTGSESQWASFVYY